MFNLARMSGNPYLDRSVGHGAENLFHPNIKKENKITDTYIYVYIMMNNKATVYEERVMNMGRVLQETRGLTMIEMIGVLGVIAVLAALIVPRVFDVITDSKIEALATATKTYETAVTQYYADIGSILPLNEQGLPQVEINGGTTVVRSLGARLTLASSDPLVLNTNLWPKFQGPYLEKFNSSLPPEIGTQMFLPTNIPVPLESQVTSNNMGWDLKGDDGNSDLPTDSHVAFFMLQGIGEEDFLKLDKIVDPLIGTTDAERKLRGRAKWDTANEGTLLLYLAHR